MVLTKEMVRSELKTMEQQRAAFQEQRKAARNSFWQCDGACQTLGQLLAILENEQDEDSIGETANEIATQTDNDSPPEVVENHAGNTDD